MKLSRALAWTVFFVLSVLGIAALSQSLWIGAAFGAGLITLDLVLRLRTLNLITLALFVGFVVGSSLQTLMAELELHQAITAGAFVIGVYLGMALTLRVGNRLHYLLPLTKLTKTDDPTREVILDTTALEDERLLDLAATGIFDRRLLVPKFVLQDLHSMAESTDETARNKGRSGLDVIKKLEALPSLNLRLCSNDFPDIRETGSKLTRLARMVDGDILTASMSRLKQATQGVRVINIHDLSKALKPLMETGEFLNILIQRCGKEEHQGVGYLEDGTMVVINGGGDYIGEEVKTRVISVKHTSAGRIVFCNVEESRAYADNRWNRD